MNNIDKDKLLHFFWSSLLLVALVFIFGHLYGSIALVIVAVLKEVRDKVTRKGNAEVMDVAYGILPILINYLLHLIQ